MKIRNGFVSNSSSSSFIVCWDNLPTTMYEIKNILFDNNEFHEYCDYSIETETLSYTILGDTKEATYDDIYDLQRQLYSYDIWDKKWYTTGYKPNIDLLNTVSVEKEILIYEKNSINDKLKLFTEEEKKTFVRTQKLGRILDKDEISDREKEYNELYNLYIDTSNKLYDSENLEQLIKESTDKFMEDNKDKKIVIYHYSDNDGQEGCVLEHGDVFSNLDYLRISHH